MSLVNMKEMLNGARKAKKAVGAFNITNYETAAAVLKAAEAENESVIIQLYMRLFDTGKAYDLAGTLQRLAFRAKVPVALHLDHGAFKFNPEPCTRNADGILVPPALRFDILEEEIGSASGRERE